MKPQISGDESRHHLIVVVVAVVLNMFPLLVAMKMVAWLSQCMPLRKEEGCQILQGVCRATPSPVVL